jgi:pimeloyl-ACP methyl ester carboxylesterase
MSEATGELRLDAFQLGYSEHGEGEPVFLVHGGVFSDWFRPLVSGDHLENLRAILVRRSGYNFTHPNRALSPRDHAAGIAALCKHFGFAKIHYVGHSFSALIGLQLAHEFPELVQSMVLIEPAPCGALNVPGELKLREEFAGPAFAAFAAGNLNVAFDRFMTGIGGSGYAQVLKETLGESGTEKAMLESEFFFRDEAPAAIGWNLTAAEISRLQQPTLILEGAVSRTESPMSQQISELALRLLPSARLRLVPGTNHMMPLQKPEVLGPVIADFVGQHPIALNH